MSLKTNQMKINQEYKILGFNPNCETEFKHKLIALGFLPGKTFNTLRCAPFGGPIEIKINKTRLAIRPNEAEYLNIIEIY